MLVAASYEGGLHGWAVRDTESGVALKLGFSFGAHIGCVRAIATTPPTSARQLLVSGGDDEIIRIYDLHSSASVGELQRHVATVTSLEFCGRAAAHLLSASADGVICVWRTRDWTCLHMLGGHKGEVNCVRAHPSARIAISVGCDRTMRLWNLMEGRIAFIKRLKRGAAHTLAWSAPSGERYALVCGTHVLVYRTGDASADGDPLAVEISHPRRVHAIQFLASSCERLIATAGDEGVVRVFDVAPADSSGQPELLRELRLGDAPKPGAAPSAPTASLRVKGLSVVPVMGARPSARNETMGSAARALAQWGDENWLCVATSTGTVTVWNVGRGTTSEAESSDREGSASERAIATGSTISSTRFTCLVSAVVTADATSGPLGDGKRMGRPEPAAGAAPTVDLEGERPKKARKGEDKPPGRRKPRVRFAS